MSGSICANVFFRADIIFVEQNPFIQMETNKMLTHDHSRKAHHA